jgi:hypothetical protein
MTCKCTLRQVFICLRLGFCLGWCSNFVGSESGQIQSVKLLQKMVSNTTQTQHPGPEPHNVYVHILYFDFGKGGGEPEIRLDRQ